MPLLADRVLESSITAGTGTLTLAGALTGYRTFNSAFSNGNVVYYTIDDGLGDWEVGYGTIGTGTLTRDAVLESSNANALVVFTSVSKRVFCTAPVPALLPDQTSNSGKVLTTNGSVPAWTTPNAGTVTSVGMSVPSFLSVTPASITSSGTFAVTLSGTALPVANGGTNLTAVGSSGNVLTSNGTAWVSSPPAASGITTGKAIAMAMIFGG
jgi:hypothetical protein